MPHLADRTAVQTPRGGPTLTADAQQALLEELGGDWVIEPGPRLCKHYPFPDFAQALAFVNRVGAVAEEQNHHPDLLLAWGKVGIILWTHSAGGLTEADFIVAAKCDRAL